MTDVAEAFAIRPTAGLAPRCSDCRGVVVARGDARVRRRSQERALVAVAWATSEQVGVECLANRHVSVLGRLKNQVTRRRMRAYMIHTGECGLTKTISVMTESEIALSFPGLRSMMMLLL